MNWISLILKVLNCFFSNCSSVFFSNSCIRRVRVFYSFYSDAPLIRHTPRTGVKLSPSTWPYTPHPFLAVTSANSFYWQTGKINNTWVDTRIPKANFPSLKGATQFSANLGWYSIFHITRWNMSLGLGFSRVANDHWPGPLVDHEMLYEGTEVKLGHN